MSEWISVETKLPRYNEDVLILYSSMCKHCNNYPKEESARIGWAFFTDDDDVNKFHLRDPHADINVYLLEDENSYDIHVTHWMPSPLFPIKSPT